MNPPTGLGTHTDPRPLSAGRSQPHWPRAVVSDSNRIHINLEDDGRIRAFGSGTLMMLPMIVEEDALKDWM